MKKSILNVGILLSKVEQQQISGGLLGHYCCEWDPIEGCMLWVEIPRQCPLSW